MYQKQTVPYQVYWFEDSKPDSVNSKGHLSLFEVQNLCGLCPDWPVPYLLGVTKNDGEILSVRLYDRLAQTIQINLLGLHRFGQPNSVLLGDSSRIDPEVEEMYKEKPSDLTKAWLCNQLIPWLSARRFSKLYVRAYFDGSDDFFGSMGFEQSENPPYLVCDLSGKAFQNRAQKILEGTYSLCSLEQERELLGLQADSHTMAYTYFKEITEIELDVDKLSRYELLRADFKGTSSKEYRVNWEIAGLLGIYLKMQGV